MKKVSFCFFLIFSTLFFSSCLGDSDSKINVDQGYGFVKSNNQGTVYVAASVNNQGAHITSDQIKSLTVGDCVVLAFAISSNGETIDGIMTATDVSIKKILPQSDIQKSIPNALYINPIKTLTILDYSSNNFFGDRWFFSANYPLKEGENIQNVRAYCYYDVNNQPKNEDGSSLTNKIVIDVRFSNTNPNTDPNAITTVQPFSFALNLSPLRGMYIPTVSDNTSTNKETAVELQFRYQQEQTDGTIKDGTLGVWNSNNSYYIIF